jgi:uncharacterized membrane protein YfcA
MFITEYFSFLTHQDIINSIVIFCCNIIASAAGLGGGGLNLPLFLVLFKFEYSKSVVLSLCAVFGNITAQILINFRRRHPLNTSRHLIYWDVLLTMLPAQISGANLGVIAASILPPTVLLYAAMTVLTYATIRTFIKGRSYWLAESAMKSKSTLTIINLLREESGETEKLFSGDFENDFNLDLSDHLIGDLDSNNYSNDMDNYDERDSETDLRTPSFNSHYIMNTNDSKNSGKINKSKTFNPIPSRKTSSLNSGVVSINDSDKKPIEYPYYIIKILLFVWIYYASYAYCLHDIKWVTKCSLQYYLILGLAYIPILGVAMYGLRYVSRNQRIHPQTLLIGDINFRESSIFITLIPFFIGILCSLLGIGGGELMGPYLLSLRIIPIVSTATTSMMTFFTATSSLIHYGIEGKIPLNWGLYLFFIGFLAGLIGRTFTISITKSLGRPSIFVFMLVLFLIASIGLLLYHVTQASFNLDLNYWCGL